jgi:type IV pilus assembly protein PilB
MKRAPAAEQAAPKRRFQRRRMRVSVIIRTDDGKTATGTASDLSLGGLRLASNDSLASGDKGIAQVSVAQGETIRADAEVVWERPGLNGTPRTYGIRFGNLNGSERFALLEAIYSPDTNLQFVGGSETPVNVAKPAEKPLPQTHHAYYMRLLRRIEQVHKLSPSDTDRVLFARLYEGRSLKDAMIDAKVINDDLYDAFMCAVYDVPFVDLKQNRPDPGVADAVTVSVASTQFVIPLRREEGRLIVAMADPMDLPTLDLLQMRNHQQVEVQFALIEDIESAIRDVYHGARLQAADRLLDMLPGTDTAGLDALFGEAEVEDLETLRKLSDATPIVSLVDSMLRSAVDDNASDIHLEPAPDKTVVRFRLDGVLHSIRTLPKPAYPAVVSRIKIMGRMDITIRHVPQDGRASMRYQKKDFDLRIATVPTVDGEKIVIRLLEKNPQFKSIKAVGFNDANYELLAPLVHRPHGMILCCGPTGSGKSTTLFAVLQEINDGTTNITTIEDPVEYRVAGVNQIEINVKRGLTFASVLRAILRQDPDIIYVGEIRDRETADLAVRAALTGHLLLSTLHTNTAVQAIARLVDIGVDPALIGSSLIAVVGQRLVRKICEKCKESYKVEAGESLILEEILPLVAPERLWRGRGCKFCHETGFLGRMPVHEVVVVDEGLRRLIARGADSTQLLDYVVTNHSFADLRDDAVQRMLDGQTTLQEVMRMTV